MIPAVFERSIGESALVTVGERTHAVALRSVRHMTEPDLFVPGNPDQAIYRSAEVRVEVDGQEALLIAQPFQLPVRVGTLDLYVEVTRHWAQRCQVAPVESLRKDVRFSAVPAGETWGPHDWVFPIRGYRWRASTYNNTWLAFVPYNKLYYHRGEDFGAIPDELEVLAVADGEIVASPLPRIQGSNRIAIRTRDGHEIRYGHMNLEWIDPQLRVGTPVRAGQTLGRTGCTWDGRKSQHFDPHLHVSLHKEGTTLSCYPQLLAAYLRMYPDPVLPVAGGYRFALPGQNVTLEGGQSIVRPGDRILEMRWVLHDGRTVKGPRADMVYERPGLYSEELIIRTESGFEDRDFAQVRVFDPEGDPGFVRGWAYHTPVRSIRPGDPVTFWNRLSHTEGPVVIDYGDGTVPREIAGQALHTYQSPGLYVVALEAKGPRGEKAVVRMRVHVEDSSRPAQQMARHGGIANGQETS